VGAGAVFFVAADFFTGAVFFAAFAGAVVTAALLTAVFFVATGFGFAASARFAALAARAFARFATNTAFRALLSLRFGFDVVGAGGSAAFLEAAHRLRWASPIAFLPAALIFRRLRLPVGAFGVAAVVGFVFPSSIARSSAICVSMCVFCCSNPAIAAEMISGVSCFGMCDVLSDSLDPAFTAGPILHLPCR
jgi:hypothetical protein